MSAVFDRDGNEVGGWGRLNGRDTRRRALLGSVGLECIGTDPADWLIWGQPLSAEEIALVREAGPDDVAAALEVIDARLWDAGQ